jgi:hypothetical protein
VINRQSTTHTIAWFADQNRANKLNLDPPYQRLDLVWSKEYKRFFIDTILQNFPSPAIFLHAGTTEDGYTTYDVVDGKQRLTAIFEYIRGEFTVTGDNVPQEYAGISFVDLHPGIKDAFWNYGIPVQEVFGASEIELREAFDRLNRNNARLTSQELRHARFSGEFIQEMERLADEPFWEDIGIATKANVKRMRNVEYVSEIFLLTMHGVLEGTQSNNLDQYYRDYDEGIPDKDDHMRRYRACMRIVENLGVQDIRSSRYKNLSDFYSLWTALLGYVDNPDQINYAETLDALKEFESQYSEYVQNPDSEDAQVNPDLIAYYDNARQGVNKAANRSNRAQVLAKYIRLHE